MAVTLIGGPCAGWEVDWMDQGAIAYFMSPDDSHPHGYCITKSGDTAVWLVDALRAGLPSQAGE